jgi:hypothetical protein
MGVWNSGTRLLVALGIAVVLCTACAESTTITPVPGDVLMTWGSSEGDQTLILDIDGDARVEGFWMIPIEDYPGVCLQGAGETFTGDGTWRFLSTGGVLVRVEDTNWTVFPWGSDSDPWSLAAYYPCGPDYSAPVILSRD